MFTDNDRNQFEDWQKKWDAASEKIAKEFAEDLAKKGQKPATQQPPTSWLTNTPMERDVQPQRAELEEEPTWRDIFYRSQNIGGLINEVKYDKGETKPTASFGGFTPTKTNPTQQSTIGPDGLASDGNGVRVTPNWSDGEDLRELDDIKRRIETMERKHHKEEVMSEKPAVSLKKQLESLRDRVQKLSEKINRSPEVDVS